MGEKEKDQTPLLRDGTTTVMQKKRIFFLKITHGLSAWKKFYDFFTKKNNGFGENLIIDWVI